MKLNRLYILSLIFVILTTMSFDISSPKLMDSTSKIQVEFSVDEKELDEKFISNIQNLFLKNMKLCRECTSLKSLVDQFYFSNIFKPPKFF